MNPYYQNWNYGYTLQPATDQSRGAYNVQYGAAQAHQGLPSNWSQIKGNQQQQTPKAQVFVTASVKTEASGSTTSTTVKTEPSTTSTAATTTPTTIKSEPEDYTHMSLLKLHELATANKLVERYEKVEDKEEEGKPNINKPLKVVLFLGNEIYQGSGQTIKSAKQMAAVQALQNTKYQSKKEQIASMPTMTTRKTGVTSTSELYEWAAKKGVFVDIKFLEPFNFEFKHSMRMWDKKEMLGNYRVQLNVAGYEFYGQAELPQQAKHNAAVQALPIIKALPDPTGSAAVVAKPGSTATTTAAVSGTTGTCGSGQQYEKNVNMALNEIALKNGCVPEWTLVSESGPQHQKMFTWQLTLGPYTCTGSGNSKKIAKTSAANQMMETLPDEWKQVKSFSSKRRSAGGNRSGSGMKRPAPPSLMGIQTSPQPTKKKPEDDGKIVITADNPVSCLYEYAKKKKIPDPEFDCVGENLLETWQRGNHTMKKIAYTIQLKIDGKTYLAESNTKKAAKGACAAEAWNSIRATLL